MLKGVPQGSLLGHINHLPEVVGNNMKLYTDDSKILASQYH